jgi:putative flippase GtrA
LVFAGFLVSGALNTGLTYLLYLVLLQFLTYRIAYTGAFICGILISYVLNAVFVFKAGFSSKSLTRFSLVYLVQYALGMVIVLVLVEYAGVAQWLAPVFVVLITVPLTFILARAVFASKKRWV